VLFFGVTGCESARLVGCRIMCDHDQGPASQAPNLSNLFGRRLEGFIFPKNGSYVFRLAGQRSLDRKRFLWLPVAPSSTTRKPKRHRELHELERKARPPPSRPENIRVRAVDEHDTRHIARKHVREHDRVEPAERVPN
jgi:hypothetical protein